jgi:hypothetical protein
VAIERQLHAPVASGTLFRVKRALLASAALHAVLAIGLLAVDLTSGDGTGPRATRPIAIEVIAPPHVAPPDDVQGGGAPAADATKPGSAARSATASTGTRVASRDRGRARERAADIARAQLGDYVLDRSGSDAAGGDLHGGDGGEGDGVGGNRGRGIGFGDGGRIVLDEQPLALPEPAADVPAPSKARPAKLIYPKRTRELGEDQLFVARITVDTDGYVVGARLVRGVSGPRDTEAADLIFRFRYLPALDDAGRAIRSTFDQPFHVNR